MDGWGSLTMLIKRQEAAKNRKASLKYELQKRRESYFKGKPEQGLEFPEISTAEMNVLKEKIRKKHKANKIKNAIVSILTIHFSCCSILLHYK